MNCKPGDLAYVARVDEPAFAENVGRVVKVISLVGFEDYWNIEANDPGLVGFCDGMFMRGREGCIRDANLRPISGVPVNDDVRDEVTA